MTAKKQAFVEMDDMKLEQTLAVLQQLPKKSRSLKEIVTYLSSEIHQVLVKGYSYKEIAELLGQQGIAIAEQTLRQYATEATKTKYSGASVQVQKPKIQTSVAPNISKADVPNVENVSTQGTQKRHPRRVVGKFTEMPNVDDL